MVAATAGDDAMTDEDPPESRHGMRHLARIVLFAFLHVRKLATPANPGRV